MTKRYMAERRRWPVATAMRQRSIDSAGLAAQWVRKSDRLWNSILIIVISGFYNKMGPASSRLPRQRDGRKEDDLATEIGDATAKKGLGAEQQSLVDATHGLMESGFLEPDDVHALLSDGVRTRRCQELITKASNALRAMRALYSDGDTARREEESRAKDTAAATAYAEKTTALQNDLEQAKTTAAGAKTELGDAHAAFKVARDNLDVTDVDMVDLTASQAKVGSLTEALKHAEAHVRKTNAQLETHCKGDGTEHAGAPDDDADTSVTGEEAKLQRANVLKAMAHAAGKFKEAQEGLPANKPVNSNELRSGLGIVGKVSMGDFRKDRSALRNIVDALSELKAPTSNTAPETDTHTALDIGAMGDPGQAVETIFNLASWAVAGSDQMKGITGHADLHALIISCYPKGIKSTIVHLEVRRLAAYMLQAISDISDSKFECQEILLILDGQFFETAKPPQDTTRAVTRFSANEDTAEPAGATKGCPPMPFG